MPGTYGDAGDVPAGTYGDVPGWYGDIGDGQQPVEQGAPDPPDCALWWIGDDSEPLTVLT